MSTEYKCPKCGQEREFKASGIEVSCDVRVTGDGYDWPGDCIDGSEIPDWAVVTCPECGCEGTPAEFDRDRKLFGNQKLADFVHGPLTECIRAAASDVERLEYAEDYVLESWYAGDVRYEQVVIVHFKNGFCKHANVCLDSPWGAMEDVMRCIKG